jgi:hypothetical protein
LSPSIFIYFLALSGDLHFDFYYEKLNNYDGSGFSCIMTKEGDFVEGLEGFQLQPSKSDWIGGRKRESSTTRTKR